MIAFSCSCGQKFKIKPEFAGRKTSCPTCKQALVVPSFDQTQAFVPKDQIDGTPSSIHQAGLEGGVTLQQRDTKVRPGQKPIHELLARRGKSKERYVIEGEIARGGMGAVLRAIDCDIRREVAVKYLLDQADPKKKLRFIEEAQISGQLEHPNIPPVHELGVDKERRLFFSMKMVKGRSLAQILDDLRQNPKTAEKDWSLGRLLNIFVNVCNGLAYAHSRNVVHRDLKPANIMVGDFGEVYVMDWGLAKPLKEDGQAVPRARGADASLPAILSDSPKRSGKVETSREGNADLTQDGAILGTPVYMPPEQAAGKVNEIDHRSDIYSLGAILYELLTLQAPIDKEGGYLAVLMRVASGEIVPPEQRTPKRSIPKELAAVAMKAMAKEPKHRYQTVEELRKDIERFQEGRSVSAKEDTKREMIWKFVKRNKGFSAGTAVAFLILMCSTAFLFQAWWETSQAKAASDLAQKEKDDRTKEAVPALVEAARLAVDRKKFPNARKQVDLALLYTPDHAEARLLKGQLLILDLRFSDARTELEKGLQQQPANTRARRLLELCSRPHPEDVGNLLAIAQVFEQQELPTLAASLLTQHGRTSLEARQKLLEIYRQRIEKAWSGLGNKLEMDHTGIYTLSLAGAQEVTSLSPLEGMPLTRLDLSGCSAVRDLTPLKGMPLTWLKLESCGVSDLTPLKGMPLAWLSIHKCGVQDLTPLKGMPLVGVVIHPSRVTDLSPLRDTLLREISCDFKPERDADILKSIKTLERINGKPAKEVLK